MSGTMKLIKIALACALALTSILHATEAAGFSVDLIHRDSLKSPSLQSSFEHVEATVQRSFNRAKTLILRDGGNNSPQAASVDIVPDAGEYLMRFGLGTPQVETLAIADTGSDLTWVQCAPCQKCFKQKAPIFDPSKSSTYKPVACTSPTCKSVRSTSCGGAKGVCNYSIQYGDRSYSRGDLATETLTLGANESVPATIIGCGHVDQGTFGAGASGIVGLGGGKESLIRQMQSSIKGKFSYCLVPISGRSSQPSKMHFGDEAVVSGAGVLTTPIVAKSPDTFYYLTLEGMSVGNKRFNLAPLSSDDDEGGDEGGDVFQSGEGNIIIDSGTTLTFLPSEMYREVETAVKREVGMKEIADPARQLKLCYPATEEFESRIPEITAHFKGTDVKLKAYNAFVKTSESSVCFAFAESTSLGIAIYGNLAQMDFLIGYDLVKKTVSFKPTDCSQA
ncbi:aspartic proteinase CDR1-like [Salvia splendens]|uniref:aspartic proteinase CDR1-like n=1 Tax=Salvia splendens TaxID=180675 RepID=UPI001C26E757|nr:aspartic proteinase CDR1-like [Salvia splendens]